MPRIPPTAVKITEEKDRKPPPHKAGMHPPIVPPMNIKIQISDFEFIWSNYTRQLPKPKAPVFNKGPWFS